MELSYNLGYQESISVHLTRRQIFAGKPYSTFPNIWEWLLRNSHLHVGPGENSKTKYIPENPNSQYDWGNDAENVSNILYLVLRIIVQSWGLRLISSHCLMKTRQSKHCGFSLYMFDNSKSKSMVRLVRAEKMVLSGLVFARKIARMILIQNI